MTQHEQQSEEWFKQRIGKITGSRVGAILDLAPYSNRDDVLRAMVREYHGAPSDFSGNVATTWGNNHEAQALMEYERTTQNFVDKAYFVTHENGWLGASPDGYIEPDGLLEIKCPFSRRKDNLFISISDQPHYYAQIQVQLYCTDREWCDFFQWSPKGYKLETVYYDGDWLTKTLPELKAFHELYVSELDNPEHLEPLRKEINTNASRLLIDEYDQLKDAIAMAQERQKEVMDELISMTNDKNALINGRKLTKVIREGSISYAKVVKDNCPDVDLEPYRGKQSESWRLT